MDPVKCPIFRKSCIIFPKMFLLNIFSSAHILPPPPPPPLVSHFADCTQEGVDQEGELLAGLLPPATMRGSA